MNFRIQVMNNGYTLTSSVPTSGKGDVVEERLVFNTKAELLDHLAKNLPSPSPYIKFKEGK